MEAHWERSAVHHALSLEQINDLIRESGFYADSASLIASGKSNANYRLETRFGPRVLRLHLRSPQKAPLEAAISRSLGHLIPIPEVLYLDEKRQLSILAFSQGETIEQLVLRNAHEDIERAALDIGSALAIVGEIGFESPGFIDSEFKVVEPWNTTLDGLFGYLMTCMERPAFVERGGSFPDRLRRAVEDLMPRLEFEVGRPCLVHADFKASNLLIHEGKLSAILDWEFAHSGTYLLDLGLLFRHPDQLSTRFERDFVAGFQSRGQRLPSEWRRLIRTIDLVSLVDFLGRDEAGPAMLRDVRRLIEGTLNDLENNS